MISKARGNHRPTISHRPNYDSWPDVAAPGPKAKCNRSSRCEFPSAQRLKISNLLSASYSSPFAWALRRLGFVQGVVDRHLVGRPDFAAGDMRPPETPDRRETLVRLHDCL